jgi:hypothetical protein
MSLTLFDSRTPAAEGTGRRAVRYTYRAPEGR